MYFSSLGRLIDSRVDSDLYDTALDLYPHRRYSQGYGFQWHLSVCVYVRLSLFLHDILNTSAAITKLDIETFYHES